jgi:hypothetical protein
MKLGRRKPPPFDPAVVELIAPLYFALEDNLERCGRLGEVREARVLTEQEHAEALDGARRIAYLARSTFELMATRFPPESIPDVLLPIGVHGALSRLAYGLTALAEEEPEPEALLSPTDLDGLLSQYKLTDWIAQRRASNPDFAGDTP